MGDVQVSICVSWSRKRIICVEKLIFVVTMLTHFMSFPSFDYYIYIHLKVFYQSYEQNLLFFQN